VTRWLDRFIPAALEGDERRRARAVVGMALLIAPWAPIIGGSVVLLGEWVAGGAIVTTGLICLVLLPLVRFTGAVLPASHLLVAGLVQGLLVSSLMLGGAGSPPTAWIALAPVVATATGGVRAGSIWTGLAMASALLIHAVQLAGGVAKPYLFGGWEFVGTVSCVGLYFLVGMFLRANDQLYVGLLDRTRAAEAAERDANRAKSAFLANMSHEIRTPLNAMLGYAELVAEDASSAGQTQMVSDLGRVQSSGRHLLELVNDILDLSKIEAGRMDILIEDVPVRALVERVADELNPLITARGNELELRLDHAVARADPARLRQCMLNLLSNAAKFTEGGTVRVECALDGGRVRVEVRDTGIGMTPDQITRVFEPFSQASATTSRDYGGTGLGLSIALRLVELMGGEIRVDSTSGVGSTFTLWLPAAA
jgi:signal transduction histidine kinase